MSPTGPPADAAALDGATPTTSTAVSRPHDAACDAGKCNGLSHHAKITSPGLRMLEHSLSGCPGNPSGNHDRSTANGGRSRHADEPTRRVDECPAREPVVHWRRSADDLVDQSPPPRWQRSANHRDDAGAGSYGVTPGTGECQNDMADTRSRRRGVEGREGQARHPQAAGSSRDPSGELGIEASSVRSANVEPVIAAEGTHRCQDDAVRVDEAAGRPASALHWTTDAATAPPHRPFESKIH